MFEAGIIRVSEGLYTVSFNTTLSDSGYVSIVTAGQHVVQISESSYDVDTFQFSLVSAVDLSTAIDASCINVVIF
jgi:hypothetical protein